MGELVRVCLAGSEDTNPEWLNDELLLASEVPHAPQSRCVGIFTRNPMLRAGSGAAAEGLLTRRHWARSAVTDNPNQAGAEPSGNRTAGRETAVRPVCPGLTGAPTPPNRRPCVQIPPNSRGIWPRSGNEGLGAVYRTTPDAHSDRQAVCSVVADLLRTVVAAVARAAVPMQATAVMQPASVATDSRSSCPVAPASVRNPGTARGATDQGSAEVPDQRPATGTTAHAGRSSAPALGPAAAHDEERARTRDHCRGSRARDRQRRGAGL